MNMWLETMNAQQIKAYHAATAELDPAFADGDRKFYEAATVNALRSLVTQAWNCSNGERYCLARSYLALRG